MTSLAAITLLVTAFTPAQVPSAAPGDARALLDGVAESYRPRRPFRMIVRTLVVEPPATRPADHRWSLPELEEVAARARPTREERVAVHPSAGTFIDRTNPDVAAAQGIRDWSLWTGDRFCQNARIATGTASRRARLWDQRNGSTWLGPGESTPTGWPARIELLLRGGPEARVLADGSLLRFRTIWGDHVFSRDGDLIMRDEDRAGGRRWQARYFGRWDTDVIQGVFPRFEVISSLAADGKVTFQAVVAFGEPRPDDTRGEETFHWWTYADQAVDEEGDVVYGPGDVRLGTIEQVLGKPQPSRPVSNAATIDPETLRTALTDPSVRVLPRKRSPLRTALLGVGFASLLGAAAWWIRTRAGTR